MNFPFGALLLLAGLEGGFWGLTTLLGMLISRASGAMAVSFASGFSAACTVCRINNRV